MIYILSAVTLDMYASTKDSFDPRSRCDGLHYIQVYLYHAGVYFKHHHGLVRNFSWCYTIFSLLYVPAAAAAAAAAVKYKHM
jgi:hypothetical protein